MVETGFKVTFTTDDPGSAATLFEAIREAGFDVAVPGTPEPPSRAAISADELVEKCAKICEQVSLPHDVETEEEAAFDSSAEICAHRIRTQLAGHYTLPDAPKPPESGAGEAVRVATGKLLGFDHWEDAEHAFPDLFSHDMALIESALAAERKVCIETALMMEADYNRAWMDWLGSDQIEYQEPQSPTPESVLAELERGRAK